jgi:hypothetical protein
MVLSIGESCSVVMGELWEFFGKEQSETGTLGDTTKSSGALYF